LERYDSDLFTKVVNFIHPDFQKRAANAHSDFKNVKLPVTLPASGKLK
jgi:hypothetical protein